MREINGHRIYEYEDIYNMLDRQKAVLPALSRYVTVEFVVFLPTACAYFTLISDLLSTRWRSTATCARVTEE